jgi:hypothetical protein
MFKLARALALVALLAAMQLAAMATVAEAQTTDRQVETAWRARLAAAQQPQTPGDVTLRRVLAREGPTAPSGAVVEPPRPTPLPEHSGQAPALWTLAAGVAVLVTGVWALVARRGRRTHRAGQTA